MVKVQNRLVVPGKPAQDGGYSVPPYTSVHLHDTGNPNSSMANEAAYLARNWQNGFYTHLVGWNPANNRAEAWLVARTNAGAWDLGEYNGNANGYASIEFVGGSIKTQAQFNEAYRVYIDLARQLAKEAGVKSYELDSSASVATKGAGYIVTHRFASANGFGSDHVDPIAFLAKWGISYGQLKYDLKKGFETVSKTTEKPLKEKLNTKLFFNPLSAAQAKKRESLFTVTKQLIVWKDVQRTKKSRLVLKPGQSFYTGEVVQYKDKNGYVQTSIRINLNGVNFYIAANRGYLKHKFYK